MSGQEIVTKIFDIMDELPLALEEFKDAGLKMADAELRYNIEYKKALLLERARGQAVNLIKDVVKGNETIANLNYELTKENVLYKVCEEKINILKKQLQILDNMYSREFARKD